VIFADRELQNEKLMQLKHKGSGEHENGRNIKPEMQLITLFVTEEFNDYLVRFAVKKPRRIMRIIRNRSRSAGSVSNITANLGTIKR